MVRRARSVLLAITAAVLAMPAAASAHPLEGTGTPRGCDVTGKQPRYEHGPRTERLVALTIDDGPERNTARFLAILDREGVRVTFFPTAGQIADRAGLVRRQLARGHMVGNHTFTHSTVDGGGPQAEWEIDRATEAIRSATGFVPCLFRAPSGAESEALRSLVQARGMITISADVDSFDWQVDIDAATIRQRVLSQTRPGSIVLLHDDAASDSTLRALPGIIDGLRSRGYRFVTVPALLGIPVLR